MDVSSLESNRVGYLKRQKRLFSFLSTSRVPPIPLEQERRLYPKLASLANIFFTWVTPIVRVGYKRTLTAHDLPRFTEDNKVEPLYELFHARFVRYEQAAKQKYTKKNGSLQGYDVSVMVLFKALVLTFRFPFLVALVLSIVSALGFTLVSLLSRQLILFVTLRQRGIDEGIGKGVGYAVGTALIIFTAFLGLTVYFYYAAYTGAQMRSVLTKALLEKSFKADAKSRHDFPAAKITTMAGTDTAKIDLAITQLPYLLSTPVSFIASIVILAKFLGTVTAVALGVVLIFLLLIFIAVKVMMKIRTTSLKFTDARISKIKEIVTNLKIIKYYSWEEAYHASTTEIRRKESSHLMRLQFVRNLMFASATSVSVLTSVVTFLVMYAIDRAHRTPAAVFSSLGLIGVLGDLILEIPFCAGPVIDGIISLKRIASFLVSGEITASENYILNEDANEKETAMEITDGSFVWEKFPDIPDEKIKKAADPEKDPAQGIAFELKHIDLEINKGELIMIVGSIGSGKTSLLNAMSGLMTQPSGKVMVNGSLLLCGEPWIKNDSIKNNIVFGSDYDASKYRQVIYSCDLESDLGALPAGDRTHVGEKGITLSGGQKSRINLARSIYADKDILLLDDVLSAVDARVGKHIMDTCLLRQLKNKTRILATHQLSFLSYADRVIFLNGDGCVYHGTFEQLQQTSLEFKEFLSHKDRDDKEEVKEKEDDDEEEETTKKVEVLKDIGEKDSKHSGLLIEKEISKENSVSWDVYKDLFKLGSGSVPPLVYVPLAILILAIATFVYLFTNTWLSFWTGDKFSGESDGFYIGLYVMFGLLAVVFFNVLFSLWSAFVIRAARNVHTKAVDKILHVPTSFLDTTPIGRILNRFTKDTDALDNDFVESIRLGSFVVAQVIGILILQIVYLPWLAIGVPFIAVLGTLIGSYYQASSREVKRLESTQRSKVLVNLSESLTGLNVIKLFKAESRFVETSNNALNKTNEASVIVSAIQRWGSVNVSMITTIYIIVLNLLCVNQVFNMGPSSVGLVISYMVALPGALAQAVRIMAMIENDMTSFERLHEYSTALPQEPPYHVPETQPEPSWPEHGSIKFSNVSMRYRPGLPIVLKNINLKIKPNEKIGICGRTGAGKSTITSAIFRLTELSEGKIVIDGIDISKLGIHELRSKLSIIPQESVLFSGTIRRNLDPSGERTDEDLWMSLQRSGLVEEDILDSIKVQTDNLHKFHLDAMVEDGGSNYSLGERQLIAFARALVRNSKILVLDEATSSVDYATDARIQNTIATAFDHCTILCVAHRLRTIINYDKILVLDHGELKEFDTPANLFNDQGSIFRSLCDKSKITESDFL